MNDFLRVSSTPTCSTCREVRQALEEDNAQATYLHYLDEVSSRAELEVIARTAVMSSTSHPRVKSLRFAMHEASAVQWGRQPDANSAAAAPPFETLEVLQQRSRRRSV